MADPAAARDGPPHGPGAPPSSAPGDYLPFSDRPFRLRMGLRALDLDRWLEVDDLYDAQLALRRELVESRHSDVVAVLDSPDVLAASEELWQLVRAVAPRPCTDAWRHPIERAGLSTQEDWCLLVPELGEYVLGAACVCFPSRWVLTEKIGRSNRSIHAPVAHYEEQLGRPVDDFMTRLTVDRPVWRLNWNLFDSPELFQPVRPALHPGGAARDAPIPVAEVGERVWLRVERQTLRKLERSGAIAFSIRVHQRQLASLADRPEVLDRLRGAVAALPEDTYAYKSLGAIADQLVAWIETQRTGRAQD